MELIPLHTLIIPESRQRTDFPEDAMDELSMSILAKGLMHPPVVRNDGVTLVAGERRVRSITAMHKVGLPFYCNGKIVPNGMLPVNRLAALTPLEIREAELEENVIRLDLTWQDKAKAYADLHKLRVDQAEERGETQTLTMTAKEVRTSRDSTSTPEGFSHVVTEIHEAILLQDHLELPAVKAAKTQKEAVKIIRKMKEAEHRASLAASFDLKSTPHTVLHGDARRALPLLPAESIDCILTDPPYGVGADTFGDMSGHGHNYVDTWENALALYRMLAKEGFRLAKKQAHAYVFCDITRFFEIQGEFLLQGWKVWPKPLIWAKGNGMLPRPEHGPRYSYETILFASKGDKPVLRVDNDVIAIPRESELLHGAQKPVSLYTNLLARSVLPGSTLLDPFGGSGTIIEAADAAKCVCTMVEELKENYNIAVSRLKKEAV